MATRVIVRRIGGRLVLASWFKGRIRIEGQIGTYVGSPAPNGT